MSALADTGARERALDPGRSLIVQAPAGSGKTGLLIQRLLALLSTVEQPEEVIAITFTRKATGEMRDRVLEALAGAREAMPPADAHARTTWALARAVRERDAALDWELERQPSRLRILTIDALCGWLAGRLVLRAGLPGNAAVGDDASPLYVEAAMQTLALVDDDAPWSPSIATVLEHLDNDAGRLRSLLVDMLGQRDQWMRLVGAAGRPEAEWRGELEGALHRVVRERLARVRAAVGAHARELVEVCAYAGANLAERAPEKPAAICSGLAALPGEDPDALAFWRGIAATLLTGKDEPRRRLTVAEGFPPKGEGAAAMKARALDLCATLDEAPALVAALAAVRALPPAVYSDAQWSVLDALLDTLRLAAASLKVVFAERGQLDHAEIAAAARLALGAHAAPSDYALALDHRIRHLLVDEFQDTSHAQFELLHALTEGWTEGDGRTLFLVGDPMQSIYRFREADVGLFELARREGIGQVRLEALSLETNFRSRPAVVEWVNRVFPAVLGAEDDATTGAVAYRPSLSVRDADAGAAVAVHLVADEDPDSEARTVVALAMEALASEPPASVAILVRARSHLAGLLPALRAAGVPFRGVEIEPLAEVPAVRDLIALVRAALDPLDRVAWLALLRAPWCGLTLPDLETLAGAVPVDRPLATMFDASADLARISDEARARIERIREPLLAFADEARRGRLARGLESAWQSIGAPACLDAEGHDASGRLLELVHRIEPLVLARGVSELERQVAKLFAEPATDAHAVEVMTMHKAKGLEFDTVILPGLARRPPPESRALLEWTARAAGERGSDILLAPVPSARGEESELYDFVRGLERDKSTHETARVLYVAATRARERLHLLAALPSEADAPRAPDAGSLLALLWPGFTADGPAFCAAPAGPATVADAGRSREARRLPGGWTAPAPAPVIEPAVTGRLPGSAGRSETVEFDWAGRLARDVGTVVHAVLREMARDGLESWDHDRVARSREAYVVSLRALGLSRENSVRGAARVEAIASRVLGDARARWLLDASHGGGACELAVAGVVDGAVVRGVVDRTFVDDDGTRWIVDYKTGRHEGGSVESFLDREHVRYRAQLERYGALLGALYPEPVQLALYYPDFGGWREWAAAKA